MATEVSIIQGGTEVSLVGSIPLVDDQTISFGTDETVKMLYETADANANALILVFPEGGAVDVPVFIIGDASILNVDLGWFNGKTEPLIAVVNDAADAYASLDAGDDAVAASKGLYFKTAADEDIELINLSVTGTPRIYWDESEDQFRFSKGVVFDALCDVQGVWVATATWTLPGITLGGTITISAQVFDAGATKVQINTTGGGDGTGLVIQSTNDGNVGATFMASHVSASPAADDILWNQFSRGKSSTGVDRDYCIYRQLIEDPTNTSEDGKQEWYNMLAGATNLVITVSSAGELGVDASGDSGTYANVELFDEYDDALVLREGIQQRNRELLTDMGVFTRKDSGSGYMMNLQPMVRLLAGGIYQTRQMLEDTKEELLDRLASVEKRILLIGG